MLFLQFNLINIYLDYKYFYLNHVYIKLINKLNFNYLTNILVILYQELRLINKIKAINIKNKKRAYSSRKLRIQKSTGLSRIGSRWAITHIKGRNFYKFSINNKKKLIFNNRIWFTCFSLLLYTKCTYCIMIRYKIPLIKLLYLQLIKKIFNLYIKVLIITFFKHSLLKYNYKIYYLFILRFINFINSNYCYIIM